MTRQELIEALEKARDALMQAAFDFKMCGNNASADRAHNAYVQANVAVLHALEE